MVFTFFPRTYLLNVNVVAFIGQKFESGTLKARNSRKMSIFELINRIGKKAKVCTY